MGRYNYIFSKESVKQTRAFLRKEPEFLPDETLVMDLKQASKVSGLPYWTLYDLVSKGLIRTVQLPSAKFGKDTARRIWVTKEALVEFIKKHER